MTQGRKTSRIIHLSPKHRRKLEGWQRSTTVRAGLVRRAKIILLRADGFSISDISRIVGVTRKVVYSWIDRFLEKRISGLYDKEGRGRKPVFSPGDCDVIGVYCLSAS